MAKLTAKQVAEKYGRRASGAVQDWELGINSVTEAPTMKAAAQEDKMRQNILAALDSGKWKKGLERVSLSEWRDKTISKGKSRYPQGVAAGIPKMEKFMGDWLPHMDALQNKLATMGNLTLEDSINRAVTAIRHAAEFKRS